MFNLSLARLASLAKLNYTLRRNKMEEDICRNKKIVIWLVLLRSSAAWLDRVILVVYGWQAHLCWLLSPVIIEQPDGAQAGKDRYQANQPARNRDSS